jgi:hypothetical protein
MLDPFGRNYEIEGLVWPGKDTVEISLHEIVAKSYRGFAINVCAGGVEALLAKCQSQGSHAAAWRIERFRFGWQTESGQAIQNSTLNDGESRVTHEARRAAA